MAEWADALEEEEEDELESDMEDEWRRGNVRNAMRDGLRRMASRECAARERTVFCRHGGRRKRASMSWPDGDGFEQLVESLKRACRALRDGLRKTGLVSAHHRQGSDWPVGASASHDSGTRLG